jgi:hypothetical protein
MQNFWHFFVFFRSFNLIDFMILKLLLLRPCFYIHFFLGLNLSILFIWNLLNLFFLSLFSHFCIFLVDLTRFFFNILSFIYLKILIIFIRWFNYLNVQNIFHFKIWLIFSIINTFILNLFECIIKTLRIKIHKLRFKTWKRFIELWRFRTWLRSLWCIVTKFKVRILVIIPLKTEIMLLLFELRFNIILFYVFIFSGLIFWLHI